MRKVLINWLYWVAAIHFLLALAMTWLSGGGLLADYHATVLSHFYSAPSAVEARALQEWWVALFGATLQAFSLFMLLLIYVGQRYADPIIWLFLSLTILFWAPQDMVISLRHFMWSHLWVDVGAVLAIVPAAIWLAVIDRRQRQSR